MTRRVSLKASPVQEAQLEEQPTGTPSEAEVESDEGAEDRTAAAAEPEMAAEDVPPEVPAPVAEEKGADAVAEREPEPPEAEEAIETEPDEAEEAIELEPEEAEDAIELEPNEAEDAIELEPNEAEDAIELEPNKAEDAIEESDGEMALLAFALAATPEVPASSMDSLTLPERSRHEADARRERRRRSAARLPALVSPVDIPEDAEGRVAFAVIRGGADRDEPAPGGSPAAPQSEDRVRRFLTLGSGWVAVAALAAGLVVVFVALSLLYR
jgi:hypothetical protein